MYRVRFGEYKMFSFFWMITSWVSKESNHKKWQMYCFLGTGLHEEQHRQDQIAYWWMGYKIWWSRVDFSIKSCYDRTWLSVIWDVAWLTRGVLLWGGGGGPKIPDLGWVVQSWVNPLTPWSNLLFSLLSTIQFS